MKKTRYNKIKEIVQTRSIETQEELAAALLEEGIEVTQATVSRDIKELMLIKVPTADGRYRYAMSSENNMIFSRTRVNRLFQDSIISTCYALNQVIIHTLPGSAQAVCVAIDNAKWPEVLGSLAGDDTILIICRHVEEAPHVMERIQKLAVE